MCRWRPGRGSSKTSRSGSRNALSLALLTYATKRVGQTLPVALFVTVLIFLLIKLLPGDPASAILGDRASDAAVRTLHQQWGLDRPLWQQYATYMHNLATGNLGQSLRTGPQ